MDDLDDIEDAFGMGGEDDVRVLRDLPPQVGTHQNTKAYNLAKHEAADAMKDSKGTCPGEQILPGKQSIWVKTFGCAHNVSDSEYMAGQLQAYGYQLVDESADADLWLVNTCTVKNPSQDAMSTVLKTGKENGKALLVAGCVPQGALDGMPGAASAVLRDQGALDGMPGAASAVLRDQGALDGMRGNPHALAIDVSLVPGRPDVSGAYGRDIGTSLADLLGRILAVLPEDGRCMLRLGMTNPPFMLEQLGAISAAMRHPCVFSYLHVPVQAASDKVLDAMNREYTVKQFHHVADALLASVPDFQLATDIICGFPGETEEDFDQTMELVRRNKLVEVLPLSTGCLGACTYCKTKHARGELGSYDPETLVERVKTAVADGVTEIWMSSEDTGTLRVEGDSTAIAGQHLRLLEDIPKLHSACGSLCARLALFSTLDEHTESKMHSACLDPAQMPCAASAVLRDQGALDGMPGAASAAVKARSRKLSLLSAEWDPYRGMVGSIQRVWISDTAADGHHLVGRTKNYVQVLVPPAEGLMGTSVQFEITGASRWSVSGVVLGPWAIPDSAAAPPPGTSTWPAQSYGRQPAGETTVGSATVGSSSNGCGASTCCQIPDAVARPLLDSRCTQI
eukprot:gene12412-14664_t